MIFAGGFEFGRSAELDVYFVFVSVVDERYAAVLERSPVQENLRNAPAHSLRVVHGNAVQRCAVSIVDPESLPTAGDAWIDVQAGASLSEPEYPLDARAVKPAGGAGVPCPSPAANVRRL